MTILRNAVESIQIGMEDFHNDDPRRVLSAIRNLYAGILLLFKCKLQELSPEGSDEALLKKDLLPVLDAKTGQATWVGTGKNTVDVREIESRLKSLGVTNVDWKKLEKLQKIRNNIEHYYSPLPHEQLKEAVANALHLIIQFCEPYLDEHPREILGSECWDQMLQVKEIYDAEMEACSKSLEAVSWYFPEIAESTECFRCPHCDSSLIKVVDTKARADQILFVCSVCNEGSSHTDVVGPAIAENFTLSYREIAKGAEPLTRHCPECGHDALLVEHGQCAACFYELEYTHCCLCEAQLSVDEQHLDGYCGYCAHMMDD